MADNPTNPVDAALAVAVEDYRVAYNVEPTPAHVAGMRKAVEARLARQQTAPQPTPADRLNQAVASGEIGGMSAAERRKLIDAARYGGGSSWTTNSPFTRMLPERMRR